MRRHTIAVAPQYDSVDEPFQEEEDEEKEEKDDIPLRSTAIRKKTTTTTTTTRKPKSYNKTATRGITYHLSWSNIQSLARKGYKHIYRDDEGRLYVRHQRVRATAENPVEEDTTERTRNEGDERMTITLPQIRRGPFQETRRRNIPVLSYGEQLDFPEIGSVIRLYNSHAEDNTVVHGDILIVGYPERIRMGTRTTSVDVQW